MSKSCLWGVDTWFWPPLFCPIGLGPQNVFQHGNLVDFGEWEIDGIWWVFRHRPYCGRLLLMGSLCHGECWPATTSKETPLVTEQAENRTAESLIGNQKYGGPVQVFCTLRAPTWIIIPIHEIRSVMSSPWLGSPWTWHCEPPWTRLRCWSKIGCFNHLVMAPWLAPCDSL